MTAGLNAGTTIYMQAMQAHWANLLTLARLASIVPCAWAVVSDHWVIAAWLFTLAAISDFADGPLARRYDSASAMGGLLDHTTDALFVIVVLFALHTHGYVPWLLPVLIVAAFTQYALDSRALAGQTLRASWLGRMNGIAYFVLVGIPLIRNATDLTWPTDKLIDVLAWLLVATTIGSIADRAIARWRAPPG